MIDLLRGLVDKSLVVADPSTLELRYRLLETIRQYADERLADVDKDEKRQLLDAHAAFYQEYAETAAPRLKGPDQGAQIVRLEMEYPNLYAALVHLSTRGDRNEQALRLAVALRDFWHRVGPTSGEIPLLDGILEQSDPETSTFLAAAASLCKADLLRRVDLVASVRSGHEALKLARKCGDPKLLADALSFHSFTASWRGEYQEALSLANEAVTFARQCGDPVLIRESLDSLAAAVEEKDPLLAESLITESITLAERSGNWTGLFYAHDNLGLLLMNLDRLGERGSISIPHWRLPRKADPN